MSDISDEAVERRARELMKDAPEPRVGLEHLAYAMMYERQRDIARAELLAEKARK